MKVKESNMEIGIKDNIEVEKLLFDSQNPRVPKGLQGEKNEAKIIKYMVTSGNVTDLMESIAETGYSDAEPLLVVPGENGMYIVVEGNRRLAALKLLNKPELTDLRVKQIQEIIANANAEIPTEVPCIVYQERTSVLDYLGYRHITGVKDWGALEKARYLDQLYALHVEECGKDSIYSKLAKMIGSRSDYVKNLHMALRLYEFANNEAYFEADIKEKDINFSWITTILGYTGFSNYIGYDRNDVSLERINRDHYKDVFLWLFDPEKAIIGESRELSKLSAVLESEKALEKLKKGSTLSEAILYTSEPEETFVKILQTTKRYLEQAKNAIEQLGKKPEEADDLLMDIKKLRNSIEGALAANFEDEELKSANEAFSKIDPDQLKAIIAALGKE